MTLLELLLVIVLLIGFYAAALWFIATPNNNHRLNEGTGQLVSLLRYSRVTAQQTGKVVQLQFPHAAVGDDAEQQAEVTTTVMVFVETEPGLFVKLTPLSEMAASVNENVKVVQLNNEASSITFYPDGSFDNTTITVYSLADEDQRKATISLNSLSGLINQQP
jgi:Tfp pilus assembly protein FimT